MQHNWHQDNEQGLQNPSRMTAFTVLKNPSLKLSQEMTSIIRNHAI